LVRSHNRLRLSKSLADGALRSDSHYAGENSQSRRKLGGSTDGDDTDEVRIRTKCGASRRKRYAGNPETFGCNRCFRQSGSIAVIV
jgi:hypothetical protein